MKVIHANQTNTVGICTDPTGHKCIGMFTPALLKEWIKMLDDMYGDDQDIYLYIRKADPTDSFVLFASSNGENPFVAVCGKHPDDGKPWENQYEVKEK